MSTLVQQGDLVSGKYRVDRVLGEGGMGVVVAATHEQLDQRVALKFLLPAMAAQPGIVQRFLREARAAVKIHSEHVARVLDVGSTEAGTPYMVMEYLEGEDLAQVVAGRGPLPVEESVGYVLQACEAVAEAHALGIVHRDLKPANLFLARRPSGPAMVKVLDFGISKVPVTAKDVVLTGADGAMGSPGYMSPEQMLAAATADARADVWSFGVVLYELLTATLPFNGETMPEIVGAILQKSHPRFSQLRGDVPAGLQEVVDRCLQKEAPNRYANVAELARALAPFGPARGAMSVERVEHVLGMVSVPRMPVAPRDPTPRPDVLTFAPTVSQPTGGGGRRWLLAVPVALGLAAFVGGAVLVVRARQSPVLPVVAAPPPATVAPSSTSSSSPASSPDVAPSAMLEPLSPTPPSASSAAPTGLSAPPAAPRPRPASRPPPAVAPPPASAAACHVASYFDADGNKHFKQVCP